MKSRFVILFSILFFVCANNVFSQDLTAKDIIEKADEKVRGKTNESVMKMEIVRPTWKRTVAFKSWSNGLDYNMTYITAPAKEKGQVFMKRETEMWNWMPTISRMIKIPSSMMSQGWMGSDYTNDDILKESSMVHDYTHKLVGEEIVEGLECYKIEMLPKENAAVIWGKIYKWVSKDEFMQVKSEYFDEDDDLIKSDFGFDFKIMDARLIPTRIEIVPNDEEGKKTVLYMEKIKFDVKIDPSFFSQQKMKRIR